MTVTQQASRKIITKAGFVNPLTHAFMLEAAAHLKLYADDTLLTLGVDYTVDELLNPAGYEINITIPDPGLEPAWWDATNFILSVEPPIEQGNDVSLGGQFGARFEDAIDYLARRLQRVYDMAQRAIKTPLSDAVGQEEYTIDGDLLVDFETATAEVVAAADAAAASEAAAAASEAAALTSANNAATAETNAETAEANAEAALAAAVAARDAALVAETNAETAETNAELAETNAELAETNAEAAQAAAAASAAAASTSASNAATSATAAQTAETNAETAEANAELAEANAEAAQAAAEAAAASVQPLATQISAATEDSTPQDADLFGYVVGGLLRRMTWAHIKTALSTVFQATSARLTDIAALAVTDSNIIVGNGTTWVAETGATARTSLGLGTGNSPQFSTIELGAATDTTLARSAAGVMTIEGVEAVTLTRAQNMTNKTLTDPAITGAIKEDVYTITDGAAFEIDPGNGTVQTVTLGANRTPLATNFADGESVTLRIADGSAFTITWTTIGVVWVGGSAPVLATAGYTVVELWKVGTTVYGAKVGDVAS